jgi:hypothetical protein
MFEFELTADEMSRIYPLRRPDGRMADRNGSAPAWD